jgi:hypothetical protein
MFNLEICHQKMPLTLETSFFQPEQGQWLRCQPYHNNMWFRRILVIFVIIWAWHDAQIIWTLFSNWTGKPDAFTRNKLLDKGSTRCRVRIAAITAACVHGWTIAIAAADAEHRWWWSLIIAVAMMVTRFERSYVICDLRLGFLFNLKLIDKAQSTSIHRTRWKTGYSVGDN